MSRKLPRDGRLLIECLLNQAGGLERQEVGVAGADAHGPETGHDELVFSFQFSVFSVQ